MPATRRRKSDPVADGVRKALAAKAGVPSREREIARRIAEAQAKLDAHEDAQRERAIAALELIAKSLEVMSRLPLSGGGR